MDWLATLGFAAACLTTGAFFPQVIRSWRTRRTDDISLGMYLMLVIGICLWIVYGVFRRDAPLIVANIVTLFSAGSVLYLKLK